MSVKVKKFNVSLPEDVHTDLSELADADLRSMHAELIVLLREAIAARRAKAKKQA